MNMDAEQIKNHALFAGGIGAFVRLAIVKPKSILVGVGNVAIGGVCSWFFSPLIVHYFFPAEQASTIREQVAGAISFGVGFAGLWVITWIGTVFNETRGNPFAVWTLIQNGIAGVKSPKPPINENEPANPSTPQ